MSISFASLFQNHEDLVEPEVVRLKTELPEWLEGAFMFTGYGVFDIGDNFTVKYYNDGYAILGKFVIERDKLTYEKKLLKSDAYTKAIIAGKTVLPEYGTISSTDPTKGYFSRWKTLLPDPSDNSNHGIFQLGKNIYVSNGQCYFQSINKRTLEIEKKCDSKKFFGLQSFSAHPHVDKDGYVYNIGVEAGATGSYQVVIKIPIGNPGEDFCNYKTIAKIPSSLPMRFSSSPSFGVTENYIILIENNVFLNLSKFISCALTGKHYCLMEMAEWMAEFKNKFHIIEKKSGNIIRSNLVSDVGFLYLHFINCFEDEGDLIVDLVTLPNLKYVYGATVENLRQDNPASETEDQGIIQRFRIPLKRVLEVEERGNALEEIVLTPEALSERGIACVYPRNDYETQPYRYCYGIGYVTRGIYANSITKFDLRTNNHTSWTQPHCFPNTVTFVANPKGQEEDDGILICGVCDTRQDYPHFVMFLSAGDMTEITRVYLKNRLPIYFHGVFSSTGNY